MRSALRGWSWRPRLRWFAAEIAVIVAGVLIALTLDSWWQGRQDAASERSYLVLIVRDLDQMEADLEELVEFESRMVEHGLRAYRVLSAKVASDEARAQVSESLAQLLNRRTMSVTDATYRDLLSTGGLRLVRDRELRDRLGEKRQPRGSMATLQLSIDRGDGEFRRLILIAKVWRRRHDMARPFRQEGLNVRMVHNGIDCPRRQGILHALGAIEDIRFRTTCHIIARHPIVFLSLDGNETANE